MIEDMQKHLLYLTNVLKRIDKEYILANYEKK